jgi:hypothetical protein
VPDRPELSALPLKWRLPTSRSRQRDAEGLDRWFGVDPGLSRTVLHARTVAHQLLIVAALPSRGRPVYVRSVMMICILIASVFLLNR